MCEPCRRLVALALMLFAADAFCQERAWQNDPRAAPPINPFSPAAASLGPRDGIGRNAQRGAAWELKGIMLAGPASHADLDGRLLALGEEIYGYTLVAVEPRRVILLKDGVREVVSFDDSFDDPDGG